MLDAAVADLTMALVLACLRRVVAGDRLVREGAGGAAGRGRTCSASDLAGATLGIVGLGRIGSAVARRAEAFEMHVIHHGRSGGVALDELLRESDVVSLHVPLAAGDDAG